jgi:large subunit ribosomal protein L2
VNNYTNNSDTSVTHIFKPGDSAPISFFEVGDFIHAVEAFPGQGSIFGRSSGTFCQIISTNQIKNDYIQISKKNSYAIVRLPSGAQRYINIKVKATLGIVSLINKFKENIQKAGRIR